MEFFKKHRPRKLSEVIGQDKVVKSLEKFIINKTMPHSLLITGGSGVGKTTIARILRRELNCGKEDFEEINAAESRGIESIRNIQNRMNLCPISGPVRVWLIDESHKLTSDAQSSFLKILEDTPSHVYFFLATTDPHKLLKTILTRCTVLKLGLLSNADISKVILSVAKKENLELTEEVTTKIVDVAEGSARKALVILNQIAELESEEEQLEAIQKSDTKRQAIELARMLIDKRNKWPDVAKILKELEEEAETVRHLILSYARTVLLGGGALSQRAYFLICCFEGNFYDSKEAGLARACYEIYSK